MFLQIHTITSYHASLLNRDDAGLAKRIPFGDATRLRVSSQCLKRHWREALRDEVSLPGAIRSRHFFEREILPRVVDGKIEEATARELVRQAMELLVMGGADSGDSLKLKQPILFGKPEADYLVEVITDCARKKSPQKELEDIFKKGKQNFRAMLQQAGHGDLFTGIEGALFGRFVTSDILSRTDASVHVAHALTVHALDTEIDYFTVVDDLNLEEETGAAHANDMELGAGIFYGYVVVDIPLLISNLTACSPTEWKVQENSDGLEVLKALMRTIATTSPGAKLGSTAPYAYSDFVLLEVGGQQPRSLANGFLKALSMVRSDPLQDAADQLINELKSIDGMYGACAEARFVASTRKVKDTDAKVTTLNEAIDGSLTSVFGR